MKKRLNDLRHAFTPAAFAALVLYAFYRLLAYSSYVTNFGLWAEPLGYVSNIPFMVGAAVGNLISCAIVFVLYASGRLRPCGLGSRSSLVLEIGRASCREECILWCRSRWSPAR